ncbi:translation initiation factor IF-2-like [Lynx canadensis]|uniref:translation initiation factor IF-2-like n=1 Tax=Lynx canadensis TaxID=61383 RepID=UPI0011B0046A|nr:translation initiation factor IF-2-like [Lynx canadensis]
MVLEKLLPPPPPRHWLPGGRRTSRPALPLPCDGCTQRTETGSGWRPQGGRHPCRRFTWEPRGPCPTASSGGFEGQDLENVDTGLEQKGLARSWSFCDFCAPTGPQPLCRRGPSPGLLFHVTRGHMEYLLAVPEASQVPPAPSPTRSSTPSPRPSFSESGVLCCPSPGPAGTRRNAGFGVGPPGSDPSSANPV